MSKSSKILNDFMNTPFPKWSEVEALLVKLGYKKLEGSGSRVKFVNVGKQSVIDLHKPHPQNTIKAYIKKEIIKELANRGLLK